MAILGGLWVGVAAVPGHSHSGPWPTRTAEQLPASIEQTVDSVAASKRRILVIDPLNPGV